MDVKIKRGYFLKMQKLNNCNLNKLWPNLVIKLDLESQQAGFNDWQDVCESGGGIVNHILEKSIKSCITELNK